MSKVELKKLKSKIINELSYNKSAIARKNIRPQGNFIPLIEIMQMENTLKNKKVDTPNHSKAITNIIEINDPKEDELKIQFNKVMQLLLIINNYTNMNDGSYEKLDIIYKQVDAEIKSKNYNLEWFLTNLENKTGIKAGNLSEAFMLLKKSAREKNKQLMINILKYSRTQPEILEQFKIATING